MRQIFHFVKTTAFGGAIFLLPFAAALLAVVKAGKMAVDGVTPLAEKLPFPRRGGYRHLCRRGLVAGTGGVRRSAFRTISVNQKGCSIVPRRQGSKQTASLRRPSKIH